MTDFVIQLSVSKEQSQLEEAQQVIHTIMLRERINYDAYDCTYFAKPHKRSREEIVETLPKHLQNAIYNNDKLLKTEEKIRKEQIKQNIPYVRAKMLGEIRLAKMVREAYKQENPHYDKKKCNEVCNNAIDAYKASIVAYKNAKLSYPHAVDPVLAFVNHEDIPRGAIVDE